MKRIYLCLISILLLTVGTIQAQFVGIAKRTSGGKVVYFAHLDITSGYVNVFTGNQICQHVALNGSTVDDDNLRFYFTSPDSTQLRFNQIFTQTGSIISNNILPLSSSVYFNNIQYNCTNQTLYGLYSTPNGVRLATLNPVTGVPTILSSQFISYGSSMDYTMDETNNRYFFTINGVLYCVDGLTGDLLFSTNLNIPLTSNFVSYKYRCSDEMLYGALWSANGGRFAKLNPITGNVVIMNPNIIAPSYVAQAGHELDEADSKYYFNTGNDLISYDINTGAFINSVPITFSSPGTYSFMFMHQIQNCGCNGTTSIFENRENLIDVFPNPAMGVVHFTCPDAYTGKSFSIADVFGRVVLNNTVAGNYNEVDVSELAGGTYFLKLDTDSGIIVKKLIIAN